MHAFIFSGNKDSDIDIGISNLAKKLHAKMMEFPIIKIDDVRALNSLIRLSFDAPTLIICKDIHEAGEEALNAFLKNLEEPQENIYFALSTPSVRKVLPTIVSRCQVIKIKNISSESVEGEEIEKFFKMDTGGKLSYVDKIKDRERAIEFAENMVYFMHRSLRQNELKYNISVNNIELALQTLTRLKGNGNVNLQLSNFVMNYD